MSEVASSARHILDFRLHEGLAKVRHWLPMMAAGVSLAFFLAAAWWNKSFGLRLLAAGGSSFCFYVLGYSVRKHQQPFSPALTHLKRHEYEEVWNSLAATRELAGQAAAGEHEEAALRRSVQGTLRNLLELACISLADEVLEIGCGIGRVGRELAPHCQNWTGSDISEKMLSHAARRLEGMKNARLVLLQSGNLGEFAANSFDVVFATNMLGHLDEIDRWLYVEEAFRVLRPGGRLFLDNIDLESDAGWSMFANDAKRFRSVERPPYFPRFSTASEFVTYASRAGFEAIAVHKRPPLFVVTAKKSA
jgi:ubiquinone/menaquinone biosynthesis C-methylase UbiE